MRQHSSFNSFLSFRNCKQFVKKKVRINFTMSRILLRKLVRQIDGVKYVSTWSPLATAFNSKATPDLDLSNKNKEIVSKIFWFFVN